MDNLTQMNKATADTAGAEIVNKNAATELGKFKDVKALMDAYTSLEAEFTRRSQRLKELESSRGGAETPTETVITNNATGSVAAAEFRGDGKSAEAVTSNQPTGSVAAAKINGNAVTPTNTVTTDKAADGSKTATPASSCVTPNSEPCGTSTELGNGNVADKEHSTPTQEANKEEVLLLEAALNNDEVKNAIITEYLKRASRNKSIPFITGGGYVSAQRQVPSSVKEAGKLAQQFLNKKEN
jgi:hypothetical protein